MKYETQIQEILREAECRIRELTGFGAKLVLQQTNLSDIETIVTITEQVFGVTIRCTSRAGDIPLARYVAFYEIRRRLHLRVADIGEMFAKHHATVLFGMKKVHDLLEVDKNFRDKYNEVLRLIN